MTRLIAIFISLSAICILAGCAREDAPPSPLQMPQSTLSPSSLDNTPAGANPTSTPNQPAGTATRTPNSGTPRTPAPGGVFSAQDVQRAWEAKGMRVTTGGSLTGYEAFTARPIEMEATSGNDSVTVNALVYPSQTALEQDWAVSVDKAPAPRPGKRLPEYISLWWNRNVVLIVKKYSGQLNDAREVFLNLQ